MGRSSRQALSVCLAHPVLGPLPRDGLCVAWRCYTGNARTEAETGKFRLQRSPISLHNPESMATGKLVPISVDSIRIGFPLAFPLMDSEGAVIANKGYSVPDRATLQR